MSKYLNKEGLTRFKGNLLSEVDKRIGSATAVTSVDGKTGAVDLSGTYQPKGNYLTSAPVTSVNGQTGAVTISVPTTPNAYVTATWKSGNNWYRKWSNGFIEQGGKVSSSSQKTTISFHTSFSSAPCVNATAIGELNNYNDNPCVNGVTTTKFVAYAQSAASPYLQGWYWFACGY